MIRNIFLDLDDTIFDFKMAEKEAIKKTLREVGIEPTKQIQHRYSQINDEQWKLLELGQLTREEVKIRRFQLLFEEVGSDASAIETSKRYVMFLSQGHYFVEGAEELLKRLKGTYRLYLVSNGNTVVQKGRLASSGIEPYFDQIFISEEIGLNKPNKEYFDYCFSKITDFKREESIILGDSLTSDIKGGMNAGIKTIWFNYRGNPIREDIVPTYTITHLSEVDGVLEQISSKF